MKQFAVITDSTSNLSPGPAEELGIPVIPLNVHWGNETYIDGVTLDAPTFYRMLQERKDMPKTSQPSAGTFIEFLTAVAEEHKVDAILAVLISAELSGTMASAIQARSYLAESNPDLRVELVNSNSASMGLGLQVLVAQQAAREGKTIEEAMADVRRCQHASHLLFAVDTLEYLHRGGRIGGAARLLGSALNLKPVLTIQEGRVEALEKVRSRNKSLRRVVDIAEERLAGRQPADLSIVHAEADADLPAFTEMVVERLKPKHLHTRTLSPVVGTHGGPGTMGVAFYTDGDV